jgi:hypothetical protein
VEHQLFQSGQQILLHGAADAPIVKLEKTYNNTSYLNYHIKIIPITLLPAINTVE